MKEVAIKESANNVSIPVEKVLRFETSISEKDQTIGAQTETINNLKIQIEKLERIEKKVLDDQKVAVVRELPSTKSKTCKSCSYIQEGTRSYCARCGATLKSYANELQVVEYRNLDSVKEDIRKQESKRLGIDNIKLEDELTKTGLDLKRVENELDNEIQRQAQELTDAKREVRERYQEEVRVAEKKTSELVEEIQKLEKNKTDVEVEESRKQEIIDLKEMVTELTGQIDESKKIPRLAKYWKKVAARSETRKAEAEKEAKEDRVEKISNKYPNTATPNEKKWWNKGKYSKDAMENKGVDNDFSYIHDLFKPITATTCSW